MGMLSYFVREDGTGEMFALNKVHAVFRPGFCEYGQVTVELPTPEVMRRDWLNPEIDKDQADSIIQRLAQWAKGSPVRLISEHDEEYSDRPRQITGSIYSTDYEEDGTTYKSGSAW